MENNKISPKTLIEKLDKVIAECPEITLLGNPALRNACIDTNLKEGMKIAKQLEQTLLKHRKLTGYGRGFAAPQIGSNKKVFVTYVNDIFKVYINPKIVKKSREKNYYRELCLSSGCLWADVERPIWIDIEYMNHEGVKVKERHEGFAARLLQHETDHLYGIVNLDKAYPKSITFVDKDPLKETLRGHPDTN